MRITKLKRYGGGDTYHLKNTMTKEVLPNELVHRGGWKWEAKIENPFTGQIEIDEFYTDKDGCGLWKNGKQILGTCQYSACATASGQRRKIIRELQKEIQE